MTLEGTSELASNSGDSDYGILKDSYLVLAKDNSGDYIPHTAQDVIDMLAEAMAHVGFLHLSTSYIPGAVDGWIDSVVALAQMPILPRLPFNELKFFEFSPSLLRWLSREFTFANPSLYDPFYTNYLKYEAMEQEYYDELTVPGLVVWKCLSPFKHPCSYINS